VEDTVATNETRTAAASFFSKFLHVCLPILTHFFRDGHEEMALYSYQEVYSDAQEKVLRVHHRVINLSEMGTGKSYTTCFLGKKFDNRMLIVSDLSVRPSWVKIASSFKVDVLDTLSFKKLTCSNLHVEAVGDSFECTKEFCELAKDTRGIMLVVDEFQALKNDSLQNRAVSALTHCLLASSPSNNIVFFESHSHRQGRTNYKRFESFGIHIIFLQQHFSRTHVRSSSRRANFFAALPRKSTSRLRRHFFALDFVSSREPSYRTYVVDAGSRQSTDA